MRPPRRIGFAFAGFPIERSTSADDPPGGLIGVETDIFAIPYVRQSEIGIGVHVLASFDRSNYIDKGQACPAGSLLYWFVRVE